ncbi:hypothetical protein AB0O14_17305 [Microbacterium foliorum]|uniref:hypothetical protein n=1 Tax=Rothia terrae TaxID=396015 RepID=UPI00341C0495
MGLSKGQKERLYGKDNTHAPVDSHPTPPAARASRYPSGQLYAEPTKSSSNMYLYVALAVAVLLGAYNYFWLLPQFSNFAGNTVPELMFTFGRDHVAAFANNIGPDYLEQYKAYHRVSALVFPVLFAGTWVCFIFAAHLRAKARNLHLITPVLFALVYIIGGFVLNAAVTNPNSGAVALASLLVTLRWVLFFAMLAQLLYLAVRLVRDKVDAFSRGELPEQRR